MQTAEIPQECKTAIIDLDRCVIDTDMAREIGRKYFLRELYGLRFGNVIEGYRGSRHIKNILRQGWEDGDTVALREFVRVLASRGIGTEQEILDYAREIVSKHALPGTKEFFSQLRSLGVETYIITLGFDVSSRAAAEYFGASKYLGNPLVEKNGRVSDCELRMKTGADKLKEVQETLKISPEKSVVLGDNYNDLPLLERAGYPMAGPLARMRVVEYVKRRRGLCVKDFRNLKLEVKKI